MVIQLFVMFVILTVFPQQSRDITPEKIIRNVEKTLKANNSISAKFEESFIWKLTGEGQKIAGEILLEGENKFRINTEDQLIVSDGKTLWSYNLIEKQVLIDDLDASEDVLLPRQIFFHYTKAYDARLRKEENFLGSACYVIDFHSEKGEEFFTDVTIWVDKSLWVPRKIEQTGIDENTTIYVLKEIRLGVVVNESDFNLKLPKDIEVIDMRSSVNNR